MREGLSEEDLDWISRRVSHVKTIQAEANPFEGTEAEEHLVYLRLKMKGSVVKGTRGMDRDEVEYQSWVTS